MLKSELMAPAAADDTQLQDQLSTKQDFATQAAVALQHSIAALGPGLLDLQVQGWCAAETGTYRGFCIYRVTAR